MFGERLQPVRVVAVARLSKLDRDKTEVQQRASIEAQKVAMIHHCEHNQITLVATFEDIDLAGGKSSGKHMNRPGLQAALGMIKARQVDGLLVYNMDRLTRSMLDWQLMLQDYFVEGAKWPATLHVIQGGVDTRSASGRAQLNLIVTMAQWFREEISEKTKAALAHKRANGVRLGAPSWSEVPENRALASEMLALREEGLTYEQIAERMNAEGRVRTLKNGRVCPWTISTVQEWTSRAAQWEWMDEEESA